MRERGKGRMSGREAEKEKVVKNVSESLESGKA